MSRTEEDIASRVDITIMRDALRAEELMMLVGAVASTL
jgi:hypothetical protein